MFLASNKCSHFLFCFFSSYCYMHLKRAYFCLAVHKTGSLYNTEPQYIHDNLHSSSQVQNNCNKQGWEKMQKIPWNYDKKKLSKIWIFYKFSEMFVRKWQQYQSLWQISHRNWKYITPKAKFQGMRWPNSTFFPCTIARQQQ